MKRRILSLLLSALMIVGVFSGCSNSETNQNEGTTDGNKSGTVKLTVWGAKEDKELLEKLADGFKQKYAAEATFDIEFAEVSEGDCKNVLLENPEEGADVFAFSDDQIRTLVAAGTLSPVVNKDTVSKNNIKGASETATINGTMYAYPLTADNGYFLYYNKAYFTEEDVKTLDAVLAKAAEANKKVVMDWSSAWYLFTFFGGTGLQLGLNDDGVTNYCTWNSATGDIKGTDVVNAMMAIASNPGFESKGDPDFINGVKDGNVIAGVFGVWDATEVEAAWGENYGATKLPTYTCAGQQIQMTSFTGYKMIGVNAYSDEQEWAHKLAEWLTNEESQKTRFVMRGQGPSNINAAAAPEVASSLAIQAVLEQSQFAVPQRVGGNYWDPVEELGEDILAGRVNSSNMQDLLDKMVEKITSTL